MGMDKPDFNILKLPIIDQIDTVLAEHYGFTPEELGLIINCDIKHRINRKLEEYDTTTNRHSNLHILKYLCSLNRSIITHTEISLRQEGISIAMTKMPDIPEIRIIEGLNK